MARQEVSMKGHRWFAALYDRIMAPEEKRLFGPIRRAMLEDVGGDVLEIGAGTGVNFQYYQAGVSVTAIEPDPFMLSRARERASASPARIELQQTAAEELPFPDERFDFVIGTLVLCSVKDPPRVLAEVQRVLKRGGQFRLYEHVRYRNPLGGLAQDAFSPLWQWLGAGCHPNRDTERALREAGFEVLKLERRMGLPPVPPMCLTRPHLRATVRRPA
jgi:ubiquinone/menaquinone biosynthesis C-methylase UbiE